MRFLLIVALAGLVVTMMSLKPAGERKYQLFPVAFYNLENLFDTVHDVLTREVNGQLVKVADKNDYEYLPDGSNKWNKTKYEAKLKNMSDALSQLAVDKHPLGPAIIGLSEVENRIVLEDLLKQPTLKDRGWKIIHEEGADRRGVDCAFFYNPRLFKYERHHLYPYIYPNNDTTHATRGFLVATGTIAGERTHVIVNHWPSRAAVSFFREHAGKQVRHIKDSILRANPDDHIIIMGDMNDDPDNKSMAEALGAKRKAKECGKHDLWNPWWDTLRKKYIGTLRYNGKWNLFDQIVFTGNLLGEDNPGLHYRMHEVFNRDFLTQQEGADKGGPRRTHSRGAWLNGYSDHFPTIVYFVKEVK